jgi:hypothetical protein
MGDISPAAWSGAIGGLSVLFSIAATIATLAWKSRGMIAAIDERIQLTRNQQAKTATVIRTKLTEMELWNRDNFVRRQEFTEVVQGIHRTLEALSGRLETRLDLLRAERREDLKNLESNIMRAVNGKNA